MPVELFLALPYLVAFGVAATLPLLGLLQYRLASSLKPQIRATVFLMLMGTGAVLTIALTNRTLNEASLTAFSRITLEDVADGFAAARYLNVFLVGAALIEIIRSWMISRAHPARDPAQPVIIAMLTYFLGTVLVQATGAQQPEFTYKDFYVPLVLWALAVQRVDDPSVIIAGIKSVLLVMLFAGLAAAVAKPDFVLHRPAPGLIPGIDWRLFGLTPHANALGPAALMAILLELFFPSRHRALRWALLGCAMLSFVLAQSKSAWMAGLVIATLVGIPSYLMGGETDRRSSKAFVRTVWVWLGLVVAASSLAVLMSTFDVWGYLDDKAEVSTLTGRFQIWAITLDAWRDNVLFGYGRDIWGYERRMQFALPYVGQAHNQIVQTLGDSGLIGLTLLLAYLFVLIRAGLGAFRTDRGLILSLLLLLLAGWVSEAPMRSAGIQSWTTILQAILVVLACHSLRSSRARSPISRLQQQGVTVSASPIHGSGG